MTGAVPVGAVVHRRGRAGSSSTAQVAHFPTVARRRRVVGGREGRARRRGFVMTRRLVHGVRGLARKVRVLGEEGMTTAEYAVGTVAAVAFAALLLAIVRSGPVKSALTKVIVSALGTGS